ncbi:uncharacterized protein METZ01_LOCUS426856, partial [marine metagenome]
WSAPLRLAMLCWSMVTVMISCSAGKNWRQP